MVNGKYHVSTRKAGSQAGMLKVADFLIAKERAAKGS
jgi:thiol:disulfide interchange protein DsbA